MYMCMCTGWKERDNRSFRHPSFKRCSISLSCPIAFYSFGLQALFLFYHFEGVLKKMRRMRINTFLLRGFLFFLGTCHVYVFWQ